MFSRHTAWTSGPGPIDRAFASLAGAEILDLTVSNPTTAGFTHPPDFYRGLCDERSALYEPASLGVASAREAVAAYYAARGRAPDPAHIGVCASSSEAYGFILGLLCDPGDVVLVPQPGYPLLRILAELAHVELVPYPLAHDGAWHIDLAALAQILAAPPRARALVVVAPNNPTGNYLSKHELDVLAALLTPRDIALIVDEVFYDYPLTSAPRPSP
ncbi:MAG TPA: pyridoxal phosphate-dependent aminotransferase, partial [Nannocystis sp.]